jgi:hypothetical protein
LRAVRQPLNINGTSQDVDARIDAAVQMTVAAKSGESPIPTYTQYPTYTPFPTYTALPTTDEPAPTPTPTDEPAPTPTVVQTPESIMAEMVLVELLSKTLVPKNTSINRYSDNIDFVFRFSNKSDENIRAFTGVVDFADIFGRSFLKMRLTIDSSLTANTTLVNSNYGMELNQFMDSHNQLKNTDISDIKSSFVHESILLVDGTQIGSVSN